MLPFLLALSLFFTRCDMPRPKPIVIGPEFIGYNGALDPAAINTKYGVTAQNCRLDDGTLQGSWGPGTAIATLAANRMMIHYHPGVGWLDSDCMSEAGITNWAVRDTDTSGGDAVSYVTQITNGVPVIPSASALTDYPLIYEGATSNHMGLRAPSAPPAVDAAGAGGLRSYRYTFVVEESGVAVLESNPSPALDSVAALGTIGFYGYDGGQSGTDTRVTHCYVYGTQEGDPNGTYYYLGKSANVDPNTSYNDTGAIDVTAPLEHDAYGDLNNTVGYFYDHSPMSNRVTCFSDRLHGSEASAGSGGAGTLFYGEGDTVGWCETGQPQYAPLNNKYKLQGTLQALLSLGSQTFAFLDDQIWGFTGAHSSAITAYQTGSNTGVRTMCGRTVKATPYGVVLLTREGLAIFDGQTTQLLADGIVDPRELLSEAIWTGAYRDGVYYLSSSTRTFKFNLRSFPNVTVTQETTPAGAYHVASNSGYASSNIAEGLYVCDYTTGAVKPWRDLEEDDVAGAAQQSATWRSAHLPMGDGIREGQARMFRVDGSGTVTFGFVVDPATRAGDTADYSTTVTLGTAVKHFMLPRTIKGKRLQVIIQPAAGAKVRRVEVEANAS